MIRAIVKQISISQTNKRLQKMPEKKKKKKIRKKPAKDKI